MKALPLSILLVSLLLGVLVGCAQTPAPSLSDPAATEAAVADDPVAPEPEPTQVELAQEEMASWQIVRDVRVVHRTTVAGFLNDQYGLTAGYGGEVHYTIDGGENWPRGENKSACRFGLEIVNENLAWTVGNLGHVRVSTDAGKTWQEVTNLPRPGHFISFIDAQTGWAATRNMLWATSDGGQTWTEVTKPEGIKSLVDVSLAAANDGYLLDKTGSLYITHDGGQTWTTETLGLTDIPLADMAHGAAIRFFDQKHGIIAASLSGGGQSKVALMQTTDGGKSWKTEELAVEVGSLFLSHDGTILTVTKLTGGSMVVLANPTAREVLLSN